MIICLTGLPGTGKTTAAKHIKEKLEEKGFLVNYYTTDWVRHKLYLELAGDKNEMGRDFTPDELERVYRGLYMLVEELIRANPNLVVIADGQFRKESIRAGLVKIAQKTDTPFFLVRTTSLENIVLRRLEERLKEGKGSGPKSYLDSKDSYEEPKDSSVIFIENNGDLEELKKQAEKAADIILANQK